MPGPDDLRDLTAERDREARSEAGARAWARRVLDASGETCPDCERWGSHEPWCPALDD